MRHLLLLLFAFVVIGVNAQETPALAATGTNSGDGEITAIITQLDANDVTLRTGITSNTSLAATNQGLNRLMADTVLLYSFVVGNLQDTDSVDIARTIDRFPRFFGGTDTANVTELRVAMQAGEQVSGTDTIDVQISWHATLSSGSATDLNSSALPCNSITTGTVDTSFDNADIPPGVYVWGTLSGTVAGRKPEQVVVSVYGFWSD